MKKSTRAPLRASQLSSTKLEKVHGGRGIAHGYYECMNCGITSDYYYDICPNCNYRFEGGRDA